jgi:hypothetical protein
MAGEDEARTGLGRDRAQEMADALLEALVGPDYQVVMRARRRADWIRANRDAMETAVDDLVRVFDTERAEAVPLELRVALTVEGFMVKIKEDPQLLGKSLAIMGLLVERLAVIHPEVLEDAREAVLANRTPQGAITNKEPSRG